MCKIDFGIVTVLGIERKAINGRLEGVKTIPGDPPDIREYYRGRLTLADGTAYELAVVQCNQAGNSDAGQAAKDLLLQWSPNYLIMLGVAGGIPRGNLKIGDVVVATEVVVYDYRRFFNHNWDPRPRHHTTDAGLLTKVLAAPDWDGHDVPPPPGQNPEAWKPALQKPGPIAVGNALFADERARDRLLKMQQDLIAIEMESRCCGLAKTAANPLVRDTEHLRLSKYRDEGSGVGEWRGILPFPQRENQGETAGNRSTCSGIIPGSFAFDMPSASPENHLGE